MSDADREGIVILLRGVALAVFIAGVIGCAIIFSNLVGSAVSLGLAIGINTLATELDKHFDNR